ncbi:MAG: recombinase family protein [Ruminococcus sp.]|uniref:recombinase family protein n=1 Tax=Ruminococcus sp. TaxID=41978 RepID=UPI0025D95EFE|nr:recombinase family protein [Ruminococcus sp.]MBR5683477.1 recombinase family protein [Ruminococcus sp.]
MPIKTAAAYIRVSTDDQLEYSPDSQIKKIKEYAQNNNIHISDEFIFIDEGISGRKAEKRPAFMKMIALAKTKPKPFDMILVWKFSRFARNREDSIVYKSMLRKQCGIDVISISEQIGEDKTSILIEALLEAMDEYYSINLAEEVKRGMNEKFSRGGVVSQPPFGYKMGNGIFVPNEKNATIVKMIFEEFVSGAGIRKIAMKLNDMGIRSTKGNLFENRTIEYILTNPTYLGKLRRNPNGRDSSDRFHQSEDTVIVDGQHEPIISEELFKMANERLKEQKKKYVRHAQQKPADFMLRGLCRCSSCGSTLVQAVRGTSLQCHKYARGQCKVSHSITIAKMNEAVINKIKADIDNFDISFVAPRKNPAQTDNINAVLLEKEYKKLERVKEAFEAGIDTLEEYKMNKTRIQKRISELETAVPQPSQDEIFESFKRKSTSVMEKITSGTTSENDKNVMLREIISHITFDRKNMDIRIAYLPPL